MTILTRRGKILITLVLCLIAAAAGDALGRRGQMPWSSLPFRKSPTLPRRTGPAADVATSTNNAGNPWQKRQQAIALTVSHCETSALWEWLQKNQGGPGGNFSYAAVSELYDRLGPAAFDQALKIADPARRATLSALFLSCIASHDPWKAMATYDTHRSEFDPGWAGDTMSGIVMNGCSVSADLAIAGIARNSDNAEGIEFESKFPPGFDFKKLVDFMESPDGNKHARPVNLQRAWAEQDPAGAAAWILEHPGGFTTFDDGFSESRSLTLAAIATSAATDRGEALDRLTAALSPEDRFTAWQTLGRDNLTFDPQLLEAATTMGERDTYLVPALLRTRINEELSPSWAVVPAADRSALLDAVTTAWDATTQLDLKARAHWRASIERQWAALPGK